MANLVDRFYAAMTVLTAHGHVKQRLIEAFQDHLAGTDEDDLPIEMRERFIDLNARMHAVAPLNGEGPICASVRKMSRAEATECAHEIVALHADLVRLAGDLPATMRANPADKADVPPFLVKSVS